MCQLAGIIYGTGRIWAFLPDLCKDEIQRLSHTGEVSIQRGCFLSQWL